MNSHETLEKQLRRIELFERIARVALFTSNFEMYGEILQLVLGILKSPDGNFGYIRRDGALVTPALIGEMWSRCKIQDKGFVFYPDAMLKMPHWGRAYAEKVMVCDNESIPISDLPEGHISIDRVLIAPIISEDALIGMIAVANKNSDYDQEDVELMEEVAKYLTPILNLRLKSTRAYWLDRIQEDRKYIETLKRKNDIDE